MAVQIKAPTSIGGSWMTLDVDRIDLVVNNDVKIYNEMDEETRLNQFYGAKLNVIITGHITAASNLVGANVFEKTKNLILAGRQWYHGLSAQDTGFPEFKWNDKTYDFLFQKIAVIDKAEIGNDLINYQLGLIIKYRES